MRANTFRRQLWLDSSRGTFYCGALARKFNSKPHNHFNLLWRQRRLIQPVHDGFSNQPKEIRIKIRRLFLYKCSWKIKFKVNNFYVLITVCCRRAKTMAKSREHHASEKLLFAQITYCLCFEFGKWLVVCEQCVWNLSLNVDFNTFKWDQGLSHISLCKSSISDFPIKVKCYKDASSSRSRNSTRNAWLWTNL